MNYTTLDMVYEHAGAQIRAKLRCVSAQCKDVDICDVKESYYMCKHVWYMHNKDFDFIASDDDSDLLLWARLYDAWKSASRFNLKHTRPDTSWRICDRWVKKYAEWN